MTAALLADAAIVALVFFVVVSVTGLLERLIRTYLAGRKRPRP